MADGATPDLNLANALAKDMANLKIETWQVRKITPYDNNPRQISASAVQKVADSIRQFGFNVPIIVDEAGVILTGHTRLQALQQLGLKVAAVIVKRGLSELEKRAYRIADNRVAEESLWDTAKLRSEMEAIMSANLSVGFDAGEMATILNWEPGLPELSPSRKLGDDAAGKAEKQPKAVGSLAERFGIPPFSVLNAREGWWQERKRAWLALGIASELGRGTDMLNLQRAVDLQAGKAAPGGSLMPAADYSKKQRGDGKGRSAASPFGATNYADPVSQQITTMAKGLAFGEIENYDGAERTINGTSVFDPVLCELAYRWFCPAGGLVLDPFAGGSVRGIVASHLGRRYLGIDLRTEQIEANKGQLPIAKEPKPEWMAGNSVNLDSIVPKSILADLIFTCPPYADLEVYSDHPADISNMQWPEFLTAYESIIRQAAARLKPARFAVIVIGDIRGPDGNYRGLVNRTVEFCERHGLRFYNEAILVTAVGSLPVRAPRAFESARKLGKTHQQVLVFVNGDPKVATEAIGACEFGEITAEPPAEQPEEEAG